jgi:hypothetical protein
VDFYSLASGYSLGRALELEHPELPRGAVLCAKSIALCWLMTGQVVYLRESMVPFGGIAWLVASGSDFTSALILVQLSAILTIVCSRFVRSGCGLLAACIFGLALLDQPLFSNNRAFCAVVLTMLALGGGTTLARLQAALVYAGASLDKLLTGDWRDGTFLRTFVNELCRVGELWSPSWSHGARLPLTCTLAELMPAHPWLAPLCSAVVIVTELLIALGYAARARLVAPTAIAFHSLIFLLTGSTFGMFFYAGLACTLLVVELPRLRAPFDRAWPYYLAAIALAGPWVRPWFAAVLALGVLALSQMAHQRRELDA